MILSLTEGGDELLLYFSISGHELVVISSLVNVKEHKYSPVKYQTAIKC